MAHRPAAVSRARDPSGAQAGWLGQAGRQAGLAPGRFTAWPSHDDGRPGGRVWCARPALGIKGRRRVLRWPLVSSSIATSLARPSLPPAADPAAAAEVSTPQPTAAAAAAKNTATTATTSRPQPTPH
ncbi:uncharacterized protein PFL1_03271 [Pseudozyma flocculosa PF-1]|uniref:Uncharacterized protein n=1 Tax=Pseudozyma flocculosa PF-1 TaxID=1277687 RepID=A0A061HEF3_9BASI|nr:uncharacterized protein PFL1_03271 [Pseudozyma flocculosa PF-1]EPQ28981.1 hypothetical protein PFL1_03271 [Pseudozyma flocculosa PF-1]